MALEIAGFTVPQIAALLGVAHTGLKVLDKGFDLTGKAYRGARQLKRDLEPTREYNLPNYRLPPSQPSYYPSGSYPSVYNKTKVKVKRRKRRGNRSKIQELVDLFG